ncbi:hypothetical protein Pan216_44680 [Planctomycetes bacterium Pan216]|uniref:Uncharacterized protein n=1 Tax=Kolteria novifilia TaxID=2527975 RepID=A0A518B9H3_9BACT|nr:hypothetical protein Pan216_44680 [Planctomycetes bacterium Pan216]
MMRERSPYIIAFFVMHALGCGGSHDGPRRYELSGSVTYEGMSVSIGEIHFEPDASKGSMGPGTVAQIREGKYVTPRGKGTVGGPYIARLFVYDGRPKDESHAPLGNLVAGPFNVTLDVPDRDATHDFELPPN